MRSALAAFSIFIALPAAAEDELPAPDSPRATVVRFLDHGRAARFELAALELDIPDTASDRAPVLARRLYLVLDRHLDSDLGKISRAAKGRLKDNLPDQVEEIGKVTTSNGSEPIRLFYSTAGETPRWVFSRGTVERIDAWYDQLGYGGILDHIPGSLLAIGPMSLPWWQWLALSLMVALSILFGWLLSWPSRTLLFRLTRRRKSESIEAIVARMQLPLILGWSLLIAWWMRGLIGFAPRAELALDRVLRIGFFVLFFWVLVRSVSLIAQLLSGSVWAHNRAGARALLPVGARIAKVLVVAMAVIAVLSELQYPVGSLVAGLGIGGLAMALAAQKTVENLFGAFSIGVDQPFREGDLVRIEDQVGVVESIGLRSTRVRTGERSAVSWPNGKLAEMRLESLSARDRLRLYARLRLALGTRSEVLRGIIEQIGEVLRNEQRLIKEESTVQVTELGEFSIDVEVIAWLEARDSLVLGKIRQELLFSIMEVVEQSGAALAARNAVRIQEK